MYCSNSASRADVMPGASSPIEAPVSTTSSTLRSPSSPVSCPQDAISRSRVASGCARGVRQDGLVLETLFAVVLLVLGAGLLTVGAEAFAEHITEAASRLGVSVLALGVLLAGAEPEEAVTAMLAAGQGHPALAAGDAIGANLVILTVAIGLAALLTPLPVSRRVMEYAAAASAAGVLAVALMWNGVLVRIEGTVLVLAYAVGVVWVWRREQEPPVIGEMAELAE